MLRLFRSRTPVSADPDFLELTHAGERLRIAVKRSAGARRLTLRVRSANRDVVLTMPAHSALKDARLFAESHAPWIQARLRRLPPLVPLLPGSILPLRGLPHLISASNERNKGSVWLAPCSDMPENSGETLRSAGALPAYPHRASVQFPALPSTGIQGIVCVTGEPAHHERRVRDFLIRLARADLEAAVARHAAVLGRAPTRITLRDTTSRWGSCSAKGCLNFSWRLILAPAYVLDYLAAHEVSHLRHMNHSEAFWRQVGDLCPNVRVAESWLKTHGSGLMRYGRE